MAYPISSEILKLFLSQYRQVIRITVAGQTETFELTENDIAQNGFGVSRYCVSGSTLELGSAISSEVDIILNNKDGRFNGVSFEGAELYVEVGIKKWDARKWENAVVHYVPIGYFTVDNSPRKSQTITLAALDRMMQFSKKVQKDELSFPMTAESLLNKICTKCNIQIATDITTLPNIKQIIPVCPEDEDLTYRTVLQWIAQLTGTCAYIDWEGKLRLEWYKTSNPVRLTPSTRYTPADLAESNVSITGVELAVDDDTVYICGEDSYTLLIEGNHLIQDNYEEILRNIYHAVGNITYRPYSCNTKAMPHLFPMDMVEWEDADGNVINTVLTNYSFSLNGSTTMEAKGETATDASYASADPMTAQQKYIVDRMRKEVSKDITTRQQAVLALNETIANSLGLYETRMELQDKSIICYYHDKPTLSESTAIYTRNAGGYAWTVGENCWNDGNPVWQYGYTRDGNAVYNALSAYKIHTDLLDAGCVTAEKLSIEYKQSVTNEIAQSETRVTQAFTVADGVLNSQISAEVTRATNAESSLSSRITQTAEDITAEVTRATNAEGELSGRINVNADSISAEVTRATNAESSLSSRITVNSNNIKAKVSSTGGTDSSFAWELTTSGFYLTSSNIEVMKVTSLGLEVVGTVKATSGQFSNCTIDDTCTINGTITANKICANSGTYSNSSATGDISFIGGSSVSTAQYIMRVTNAQNTSKKAYVCVYDVQGSMNAAMSTISTGSSGYLTTTSVQIVDTTVMISGETLIVSPPMSAYSTLSVGGALTTRANVYHNIPSGGGVVFKHNFTPSSGNYAFAQFDKSDGTLTASQFYNYNDGYFCIYSWSNAVRIGSVSDYNNYLLGTWYGSLAGSSSRNIKTDIEDLSDKHSVLFDNLIPRTFKYIDGNSGRTHYGYIVDELKSAMDIAGLSSEECAAYCLTDISNPDGDGGIRYDELAVLATHELQKLKKRVAELEKQLSIKEE